MAVIEFINNKNGRLKTIIDYVTQTKKTINTLIYGKDCNTTSALQEFEMVKKIFDKNNGRLYYHFIQSFNPKDNVTLEVANKIGQELAEYFNKYQVLLTTHFDKEHIHNHFIINSVSFENGKKYQQSKIDLQNIKDYSDKICLKYGLSIIIKNSNSKHINRNEYRTVLKYNSFKFRLKNAIDISLKNSISKSEFIANMNQMGYKVNWNKDREYITYTTPEGYKCRDIRLNEKRYLKENMEPYFKSRYINNNRRFLIVSSGENELEPCSNAFLKRELSKQANKEYAIKMRNSSMVRWDDEIER